MAHDAMSFPKGLKPAGADRKKRWSGRDADPLADALDAIQEHLQNSISDPDDLNQAQALLSRLLETAMPDSDGEDSEAPNDPEVQRRNPDNFQGQDRGKRMAGDSHQPPSKLEKILGADTGRRRPS